MAHATGCRRTPPGLRDTLDNINGIFDQMRAGKIEGRIVLEF